MHHNDELGSGFTWYCAEGSEESGRRASYASSSETEALYTSGRRAGMCCLMNFLTCVTLGLEHFPNPGQWVKGEQLWMP